MSCFSRFFYVLLSVMKAPLSCKSSLERNKIFFYISLFSLTFNIESCSDLESFLVHLSLVLLSPNP
uniref:Uncharacterized protein n=1 Tax=Helianthus annuus TaxID=4232 RepID=A0A251SU05_HELAN